VSAAAGQHPVDDLAAYALDAVDAGERRAVEEHLAACRECRDELAAHARILSWMVEDEAPPATVWADIVDLTVGPASLVVVPPPLDAARPSTHQNEPCDGDGRRGEQRAGEQRAGGRRPGGRARGGRRPAEQRRGARRRSVGVLAAAAALLVAVGVAPRVWTGLRSPDDPGGEVAGTDRLAAVLTGADGEEVARVVTGERGTFVVLDEVAPLPSGRTYQLWSLSPEVVSLGLLGDGGGEAVRVTVPEGSTRLAISDEPAGGSPTPTGPIAGSGTVARDA
jgi:anti-sigma-K factor RskA